MGKSHGFVLMMVLVLMLLLSTLTLSVLELAHLDYKMARYFAQNLNEDNG